MTIQELFILSNQELKKVIDQIASEQWDIDMPKGLTSKPATLYKSVCYHTYDDAWVPDVLAGKTKDEIGDTYEHLLSTPHSEVISVYDAHNERAIEAVRNFDDLAKQVHLSYGDFSARDYLQHIISFRGLRSYDIAKLIGLDTTMSVDLIHGLQEEFEPVIEGYRQMGVFPSAIEVPDDADPQTKLLGMMGRE